MRDLIDLIETYQLPPFTQGEDTKMSVDMVDSFANDHTLKIDDIAGMELYLGSLTPIFYIVKDGEPLGYIEYENGRAGSITIKMTYIRSDYRMKGLGIAMYRSLLDKGYTLISDLWLSKGAMRIWEKLINDPKYNVAMKIRNQPAVMITSSAQVSNSDARFIARK